MKLKDALSLFDKRVMANVPSVDRGEDQRLVGYRISDNDTRYLHEPLDGLSIIFKAAQAYLLEHGESSDEQLRESSEQPDV